MKLGAFKKILATVLTVSLAAASLSACGSSTPSESSATVEETAGNETNVENADAEGIEDNAEVTTIKAVTGGNPKPYVYVDENGEPTGYDIEVLKAAFELLPEYELEIEVADFSAVFAGLQAGNYQIGVNNFSYNEERGETYLYSLPYDKVSYVFVYKKGGEPITSLKDVAGKTFEGGAGVSVTNAIEKWNELNPDAQINIAYTEADTAVQLQHIEDGSVDFGIIDGPMYTAYIEEYGFDIDKSVIPEEEVSLIADNLYAYYLLPKDQADLRERLDEAIVELKKNGTLKALSEQFFDVDQSPEDEQLVETIN